MQLIMAQTTAMNTLQANFKQMQNQIVAVLAQGTTPPADPPAGGPTPNPTTGYVMPLTMNPAAGVSPTPSLLSQFRTIDAATITSIIQHDLRANKLYKLDTWYHDKGEQHILACNGTTLEVSNWDAVAKEYKALNYFQIILVIIPISDLCAVTQHFMWSSGHMQWLVVNYDWPALLAYHNDFFNMRRREMAEGNYDSWGRLDHELHDLHSSRRK